MNGGGPGKTRVVHVVYSFSVGGLENVIVQLINRLPAERFEHIVLSLTTVSDFKNRIERRDVRFIELHKPPGHAWRLYPRIYRLLRQLRPDVVHSCNLAALELAPLSWLARVPRRIHAEHGWDAYDPQGRNQRYQRLRRFYRPFIHHYVSVSQEIDNYLAQKIGVPASRRSLIANGVDTDHFSPAAGPLTLPEGCPFGLNHWLIGTVGRLQTVKNQPLLARAFVRLLRSRPELADRARLVMIGEGPLRNEIETVLSEAGMLHLAWLPGARGDVAAMLRLLALFVLPSQAEGTSCTLQEAMATGLPTVATAVGGTPDLIEEGVSGNLVASDDALAMALSLAWHFDHPVESHEMGMSARQRALLGFAISGMTAAYQRLFTAKERHKPA